MTTGNTSLSVREIARRLGLSNATVSRALNNHPEVAAETRSRVLRMADENGYVRRIGKQLPRVIGLVYPTEPVHPDFGSFESAMLAGVMRGVNEQKFDITLVNVERDIQSDETYTHFFRRKGVRGAIVRSVSPNPKLAEAIADEGFPFVLIADRSDHPGVNFIRSESRRASQAAIEHLIHLGHERIALVVHTVLDADHRDRVAGYERGLAKHSIDVDPSLVVRMPASMDGGTAALERLLSLDEPPTAVYVTNPLTTIGLLHRCLELKIHVPEDLSVIGFDDSDVRSRTFPKFTAITQDAAQFGLEAARWLTRSIEGVASPTLRLERPAMLSFGDSTGIAPASPVRLFAGSVVRAGQTS